VKAPAAQDVNKAADDSSLQSLDAMFTAKLVDDPAPSRVQQPQAAPSQHADLSAMASVTAGQLPQVKLAAPGTPAQPITAQIPAQPGQEPLSETQAQLQAQ